MSKKGPAFPLTRATLEIHLPSPGFPGARYQPAGATVSPPTRKDAANVSSEGKAPVHICQHAPPPARRHTDPSLLY